MRYDESSKTSSNRNGVLAAARISLHRNGQGYFIAVKDEQTHAQKHYGPYEGPLSFSQALILLGTLEKVG